MGFYDTKMDGPMVVEIPPAGADGSLNGNIVTLWQTSLEDAGLLGVDKGAGAKFVITPPGFADRIPDDVEEDRRGRVLDLGQREELHPLSVGNGPLDVDIAAAVQIGANQEVAGESIGSQPVKARKARCSHPTK